MIHILIVEDDKELNRTVCRHLSAHNYLTVGVLRAEEAFDQLYAGHFDLVISDIMMPGMDGFEFAETVRRQDKNIPILFMTARDDFASKERGYHLGIDDYLVKPINLNELVLHVEALLRRANIAAERKLVVGSLVLNEDDVSAAVCVLFAEFRKRAVMKPVYQICEAAKKVTQGDFSVRIAPMRTDGKKDEFEVLFEDFNTMAAELASIEILKNDFVTNVSHELKTPLAVIQNYATILQSEQLSETEMREYSAKIGEAVERLSVLVTNILQVNRLENQNIQPVLQPFNISEALCRCILNYDNLLDEKNLTLDTELDQNIILTSNEELLDLVWNNLLSNAIKFTPDDGHIEIELRRDKEWVYVKVSDDGCGIGQEALKHIFDKFYQADTAHTTQGNGLGLALARRNNMKIEVRNKNGISLSTA